MIRTATLQIAAATMAASLVLALALAQPAAADPARERTAFLLSGDTCSPQREALAAALMRRPGVILVDFSSVPDHILVDHLSAAGADAEMATVINDLLGAQGGCRAEAMKSCITAGAIEGNVAP